MVAEQIFVHMNSAAVHLPSKMLFIRFTITYRQKEKSEKKKIREERQKTKKHAPRKEWEEKVYSE